MKKISWHTETRKIKDLSPFEGNPRKISPKDAEELRKSLERFGLADIPVIQPDGTIIGGHQRIDILKESGEEEIEVRVPDHALSRKEFEELNLRLNKNQGEWEMEALANFDKEMLLDVGFEGFQLDDVFRSAEDDEDEYDIDAEIEKIKKPKTILGDLYALGANRLLCGDSTKTEDVEKLMAGEKADMIFTDPPYNVNYEGMKHGKILNDHMESEKFIEFSEAFIARMRENSKAGAPFYICSGYSSFPTFLYALRTNGFHFSVPIVWVKNNTSLGWGDYRHKHEMIIKAKAPKEKKKKAEPIMYGWNEGKHFFPESRFEADVWEFKRRGSNSMVHPTQKPIALINRAIKNSSKRGGVILDLFGGSGSTLIAAEKTGRRAFLCELDPKYCDAIVKRWESLTNNKAQKL